MLKVTGRENGVATTNVWRFHEVESYEGQLDLIETQKELLYHARENMRKMKQLLVAVFLITTVFCGNALASDLINMDKIKRIESSGNALAYNKSSEARGLYQITPIVLKEYNNFHKEKYSKQDLFNAGINEKIARWYINVRIPQMLKYYKRDLSIKNILISYNAGISYVVSGKSLPTETKEYIIKYLE
jgi:hypothetical protein